MSDHILSLVSACVGATKAANLLSLIETPAGLPAGAAGQPSRAEIAHALNVVLFDGILTRVPTGREYTEDVAAAGGKVNFDHGALRTVAWRANGQLPPGEAAFTRDRKSVV